MKIIKTKWQKLIISLFIIITLFNVVFPTYAHADFGGTLFQPIAELICGIGDSILNILQQMMLPGAPKAVVERSAGDLIAEDLRNTGNPLDWIQGAKMSIDSWFAKQPLLGDIYRGVTSVVKGLNPINIAKNWVREVKKNGILGAINPLNYASSAGAINSEFQDFGEMFYENKALTPFILYSPYAIFSNSVPALDINFINPSVGFVGGTVKYSLANGKWDLFNGLQKADENDPKDANSIDTTYTEDEDADPMKGNVAKQLQSTIATWYVALRNISIVAMLSVLIYVAIRIILSSTAGETAKYKTLLKDWLIGLCLLFTLHYMMAFMLKSVEIITDLFSSAMSDYELISEKYTEDGHKEASVTIDPFMTISRMSAVGVVDSQTIETDLGTEFSYTLVYLVLVFYTLIFTWKYIKRFVYIAFLTIISPLVAFTYPIDKMKDGSAQAFNMWMKEYIYNVLIQPVHLLLYIVLIGSAIDLATDNLIYTVVATGFLLEAEKIIKSLFGFNKASGGEFSSAVTGGLLFGAAANAVKKGFGMLPGDDKDKKGGKDDGKDDGKIRMDRKADSDKKSVGLSTAFGGSSGEGPSGEGPSGEGPSNEGSSDGSSPSESGVNTSHILVPPPIQGQTPPETPPEIPPQIPTQTPPSIPTPPPPPTSRRTIKLGSGVAKGRYTSPSGKITNRIGNKYNNSKFGKSKPGKVIKGVAKVGGAAGKKLVTKKNAIKFAKATLATTGAVVGGAIGIAGGLASDNPGDILKYGALGAGAGAAAGNATVGATVRGAKATGNVSKSIREQYETGAYGKDEAQRRANERADKKWRESAETKRYYKDKYEDDWEDAMASAEELRKRGIVEQKEIDQAIKMTQRNEGLDYDQAAAIMKAQRGLTAQQMRDNWDNIYHSVIRQAGDSGTADMIMDEMNENLKE